MCRAAASTSDGRTGSPPTGADTAELRMAPAPSASSLSSTYEPDNHDPSSAPTAHNINLGNNTRQTTRAQTLHPFPAACSQESWGKSCLACLLVVHCGIFEIEPALITENTRTIKQQAVKSLVKSSDRCGSNVSRTSLGTYIQNAGPEVCRHTR